MLAVLETEWILNVKELVVDDCITVKSVLAY